MALLGKELKITFKSLTYWVVVAIIGLFVFTQLGGEMTALQEPLPDQDDYGVTPTKNPQKIQEQTYGTLYLNYYYDDYVTYPLGFAKSIHPSDSEKETIRKILVEATGMSLEELETYFIEATSGNQPILTARFSLPVAKNHSYDQFQQDMQRVSEILGSGSSFEKKSYLKESVESKSFQQAKADFEKIKTKDHISGAYARMICDYFGIILALIPIFLTVTVMVRDHRSKARPVIFTKTTSSAKLVLTRYASTVQLLLLPVLIFALMPATQTLAIAGKLNTSGDLLLFYQYLILWLGPTILAVVGIGFLVTEWLGGIPAIILQLGLWLASIMANSSNITGGIGWSLIPRFNEVGQRSVFETIFSELVRNRILWSAIGIICCILTIFLMDYQRKGGTIFGKKH